MERIAHISRRKMIALGAASVCPIFPTQLTAKVDFATTLAADLNAAELPSQTSKLHLMTFSAQSDVAGTAFQAKVRLTWEPGVRDRSFRSEHIDPQVAYKLILRDILQTFVAA